MRTPLREIRANMRGVVLTSTLLVVVTAAAVAVAAHVLLDGRDGVCAGSPWPASWTSAASGTAALS
jgi:CPA1 family monovalent cation:H+ antiporter